jgi:hypothetical protein
MEQGDDHQQGRVPEAAGGWALCLCESARNSDQVQLWSAAVCLQQGSAESCRRMGTLL